MADVDVAALRNCHQPMRTNCRACGQHWPCDATRLLARLEAAERVAEAAADDVQGRACIVEPSCGTCRICRLRLALGNYRVVAGKGGAS